MGCICRLVKRSCKTFMMSLRESFRCLFMDQDLPGFRVKRPCGYTGQILCKRSLHIIVQVLMGRSCGDPGGSLSQRILHEDLEDDLQKKLLV